MIEKLIKEANVRKAVCGRSILSGLRKIGMGRSQHFVKSVFCVKLSFILNAAKVIFDERRGPEIFTMGQLQPFPLMWEGLGAA